MTISTLELATAVLDWARTPGTYGRIEVLDFVTLAHQVVNEAAYKEHQAEDAARQRQRHGEAIARREAANTPWPAPGPTKTEHARCNNCDRVWPTTDLDDMTDFWERYSFGSLLPAGDCPCCGTFCYFVETAEQRYSKCPAKPGKFDVV